MASPSTGADINAENWPGQARSSIAGSGWGGGRDMIEPLTGSTRYALVRGLPVVLLLGLLSSCIASPDFARGEDHQAFLEAYRAQSMQAEDRHQAREAGAIKRLRVQRQAPGGDLGLSVDLDNADLARVLALILNEPEVQYRASDTAIRGRVSARFTGLPLVDGLNILLANTGYRATLQGGLLWFEAGGPVASTRPSDPSGQAPGSLSREVVLQHLAAADVVQLITDLFSGDNDEGKSLTIGSVPELNAVYVAGPSEQVDEAMSVISRADRPVAHVIIEVLIVDIDTSSVEALNLIWEDGVSGKFDGVSLIPGQSGGNVAATFSDLAGNAANVSATIDFLAAQNVAHVIARPYIATRSTRPATLEIVDDQFARVDTSGDESSIITTDSITAGISMQITPIVMADESVRLDVTLEDSRFGETAGDIVISKERNTASTSMVVKSGQTIVIGGLNAKYRISENSGLPWLRHIPILKAFAANQGALETRNELMVYLTPYVWVPGLDLPMPLQGEPHADMPGLLSLETFGQGTAPRQND